MSHQSASDAGFVRDRMEITNLIHSYAHHADNGDTAAFADLFLGDAVIPSSTLSVRFWPEIGVHALKNQWLSKFNPNFL